MNHGSYSSQVIFYHREPLSKKLAGGEEGLYYQGASFRQADDPELFKLLMGVCSKDWAKLKRAVKATTALHETQLEFVCETLEKQCSFYTSENHWCSLRTDDIELIKRLNDPSTLKDWGRHIPYVPRVLQAIAGSSMPRKKDHTVVLSGAGLLYARNPQCGAYQTLQDCLNLCSGVDTKGFSRGNLGSACHYRPDQTIKLLRKQQPHQAAQLTKQKNLLLPPEVLGITPGPCIRQCVCWCRCVCVCLMFMHFHPPRSHCGVENALQGPAWWWCVEDPDRNPIWIGV
jgi:hypothetical protein